MLVAAQLIELDDPSLEMNVLHVLVGALFKTNSIEEVEPMVLRYRVLANAQSAIEGFCLPAFNNLLFSARLQEVLCLYTPRLGTPDHSSVIASSTAIPYVAAICVAAKRVAGTCCTAPEKMHAPVEPYALCRHTGSLKRPRWRCALCST